MLNAFIQLYGGMSLRFSKQELLLVRPLSINKIFPSFRVKKTRMFSSQAAADGPVVDFQTSKILPQAKRDVNATLSDWSAFNPNVSSAI